MLDFMAFYSKYSGKKDACISEISHFYQFLNAVYTNSQPPSKLLVSIQRPGIKMWATCNRGV
jgi:hypothetical protein